MSVDSVLLTCQKHPDRLVSFILMASYMYYVVHEDSPISDGEFDALCKTLLEQWDAVKHPHKRLIDCDALRAGSLYQLKDDDYPQSVKNAAKQWQKAAVKVLADATGGHLNER